MYVRLSDHELFRSRAARGGNSSQSRSLAAKVASMWARLRGGASSGEGGEGGRGGEGTGAAEAVEVVSGCSPLAACLQPLLPGEAPRRSSGLGARVALHEGRGAAVAALAAALDIDDELAAIVFDQARLLRDPHNLPRSLIASPPAMRPTQVRCARCGRIASDASTSSFWQQIHRLHERFKAGAAFRSAPQTGADRPAFEPPAVGTGCKGRQPTSSDASGRRRQLRQAAVPRASASAGRVRVAADASEAAAGAAAAPSSTALRDAWRAWAGEEGLAVAFMECSLPPENGYHSPLRECVRRFARGESAACVPAPCLPQLHATL